MNCDFCDEINNIETIYNKIYGGKSRVVCSTEHFIVFPCMGQLREGHLLIISKKHINAIGLLDVLAMEELRRLLFAIVGYFKNEYGKELLCFEHGALSDDGSYGGCGIFHMHLHLLPIIYDEFLGILNYVKNQDTNAVNQVRDLTDTRQYAQSSKTYIFLSCIGVVYFAHHSLFLQKEYLLSSLTGFQSIAFL